MRGGLRQSQADWTVRKRFGVAHGAEYLLAGTLKVGHEPDSLATVIVRHVCLCAAPPPTETERELNAQACHPDIGGHTAC